MSDVLVNGKCVCITQGTAPHPPDQSAEEVEVDSVMGRSLAQINSRLFELTGTLYLNHVLHLQVNPFPVQSIEVEQTSSQKGTMLLHGFAISETFWQNLLDVKRLHCVRRWSQRNQGAIYFLCLPAAGMPQVSKCEF
jgi:hypothetical protein